MTSFKDLKEYHDLIDHYLEETIKSGNKYENQLHEAMEYCLFTGGKRLRPLLTLKTYEMYDSYIHDAMPFAMAIEMIHTYSLIHDDLPSMDNDDYRRGKPTCHKKFGEALAILTGDALLNLAFQTIFKTAVASNNKRAARAGYEIAKASGHSGMIGGQVLDVRGEEVEMSEDELFHMYKGKTAALIQASILAGAIAGGAPDDDVAALRLYGEKLGIAYQLQDDLLDYQEDSEIDKNTYLSFHGEDETREKINELSDEANSILHELKHLDTEFFQNLTMELIHREV
ncbi:polyprenyl synthetase family protein [Gudongella sp. DL1XJH-153]|uniref:polyprenyl synthetase family protein n=1 Tax=Gudongella sp. DL1XJH-153 TaxID=3409804 RepID=UPI003BB5A079